MAWRVPAAMVCHWVSAPTWIGTERLVVVPSPIWPYSLVPQHHRVPLSWMPQVNSTPADTALQVVEPIFTGALRCVVVLSPTSPAELSPQHHRVSSDFTAQVWAFPASTDFHVAVPTCTGVGTGVKDDVPVPSWP